MDANIDGICESAAGNGGNFGNDSDIREKSLVPSHGVVSGISMNPLAELFVSDCHL